MQFIKFSSIENSYQPALLKKARDLYLGDYVVTEKLHGSNIGFYYGKDKEPRIASRNGFTDENFYNMASSTVIQDLMPRLQLAADAMLDMYDTDQVIIYGELVGNGIQKGVFYSKDKSFYAFRISFVFDDEEEVLDYASFSEICDKFDIPQVPFIYQGKLDDCLKISNAFDSLVANIPDNICEGVVISPVVCRYYGNGNAIMFKNKNDKFREKSVKQKEPVNFDIMDNEFLGDAMLYITENLAQSIISKFGCDITLMPFYMKEFNEEMVRELGAAYEGMKMEKKYLMSEFIKLIKPLLRAQS